MARIRGPKFLTCFYCGKRTKTKYDGFTRDFLCLSCDATNYLDENGEITDPPVATEREAPATHYATQRQSSPTSSQPQDNIFCATCLKNQRLFTASLAQYLPDDPSHPDYPELERNYYRYRKSLEERYPQVCEDCVGRVEGKIRQAGYTAKTDHLRRMMERSRGKRTDPSKTSVVDWANTVGRGLWWGGLVMQMLWHIRALCILLSFSNEGMYDPDDKSWSTLLTTCVTWVVAFLPPPETLISGAISAGIMSVWWNPQFVQVTRGFTRHLLGFTQWYAFQGVIIFFRFLFRRVLEMQGGKGQSRDAQLSAHCVMALLMMMIYSFARKSIKVDTTPLFGASKIPLSPKPKRLEKQKKEDSKTLSEILNEALDSPTIRESTSMKKPYTARTFVNSLPPPYPPNNPVNTYNGHQELRIDTLGISPPPQRTQQVQYSEEMDWSPTQEQSQHRAFAKSSSGGAKRAFGQAPTHPESSPFWYKVPAAPSNPAHRMRNPPNVPILRSRPASKENVFFTSKMQAQKQEEIEEERGVTFNQPKFFAPRTENDEANSLADMLGSSFTLGQEQDDQVQHPVRPASNWAKGPKSVDEINFRSPRAIEAMILAGLLSFWLLTASLPVPFGRELQLAMLSAAGTIAIRVTGDSSKDMKEEQTPSTATYVGSVLSVLELAAVCWLGWEVWKAEVDTGRYGFAVLATMLGHQVWNTVCEE